MAIQLHASGASAFGVDRLRELLLVPNLISLTRVPLAVCFPFAVGSPPTAVLLLALAGLSDVLDGWFARKYGLTSVTGTILDPITDKLFVLTVAITLVVTGHISPVMIALLSLREIGELPLLIWFIASPSARGARAKQPSANAPGKLATSLQFVTVAWALFRAPGLEVWVGVTAVVAGLSALTYWKRALAVAGARSGSM